MHIINQTFMMILVKVGIAALIVACAAQNPYFRRRLEFRNKNHHAPFNRLGLKSMQTNPFLNRVNEVDEEEYCDEEDENCPGEAPKCGDKCSQEGKLCHYDPETCCEEQVNRTVSECKEGAWNTTTKASCIDDPCPGQCPVNVPNSGEDCSLNDLECKYMESQCCEQTIFGVTALCVKQIWKVSFNWKGLQTCQKQEQNKCEQLKGSPGVPPDNENNKPQPDENDKGGEERSEGNSLRDIFEGIDDYPVDSNEALVLDNIVAGIEERAEVTSEVPDTEAKPDIFAGLDDDLPLENANMDSKEELNGVPSRKLTAKDNSKDLVNGPVDSLPSSAMDKTNTKECPLQPPLEGSICGGSFHICHYDQDDCCGQEYNHLKVICYYGHWINQLSKVPCEKQCDDIQRSTYLPYEGLFGYSLPTTTPVAWNYPWNQPRANNPYQGFGVTFPTTYYYPSQWNYPGTSEMTSSQYICPRNVPLPGDRCWIEDNECQYGTQLCCGQEYPEVFYLCTNGVWQEELYQTPCASGDPCPMMECPSCLPKPRDRCQLDQDVVCKFDEQECCGVKQYQSTAYCQDDYWHIVKTLTLCDLGKPCPNNICPEAQPDEGDSCELHREVYCFYNTVTCCDGRVSHNVHASCQDRVWRVETKDDMCDTNCDDDDQCPLLLPEQDTACSGSLQCNYHAEECCGHLHHAAAATCSNNTWSVTWYPMTCRLQDCLDLGDSSPGPCPMQPPELFTDCGSVGIQCVYLDEPCCSQVIMCDGNNWLDVSYPPFCEQDATCIKTSKLPKNQPNQNPGPIGHQRPKPRFNGKKKPMKTSKDRVPNQQPRMIVPKTPARSRFNGKKRPMKIMKRPFPKRLQKRFPMFKPIKHVLPRRRTKKFGSVQFLNRNINLK